VVTNTVTGQVTCFTYDGNGNRVKVTSGVTTTVYVGNHYEVQGATVTKYYTLGSQRIAMRQGGTLYYLHADHLGSASLTTCGNTTGCNGTAYGAEVPGSRTGYYPYGGVRYGGTGLPTDRTFTGQQILPSTGGLMYYGARMYDPAIGRFISADTIVPQPGNPQTLNRYAYCLGNPLKFNDPSGHWIGDWLVALGRSGPVGKAMVVGMGQVAEHVSRQTQRVFYPDANTTTADRLLACAEIGGGSVVAGAIVVEVGFGTLGTAATAGATELADDVLDDAAVASVEAAETADDVAGSAMESGVVYRGGSATPVNLTPRLGVDKGLSTFDTLEAAVQPGGKAQVIDVSRLGLPLQAFPDTPPGHVSIRPSDAALSANPALIDEWAATRGTETIHSFTQSVIDAIIGVVRRN
jgi:RHS repeat-associated protein